MKNTRIDINADLGEGMGNDISIMPLISSCNIACGGHYGTRETISEAIQLANTYNVKIGAHPSYPDMENFGRKVLDISEIALKKSIQQQVAFFLEVCASEKIKLHHIKLHGALYNKAATDKWTASVVLDAFSQMNITMPLYVPYNSALATMAKGRFPLIFEAFIDRKYTNNGTLVARSDDNSVINTARNAWKQLFKMIREEKVMTISGEEILMKATTFCIHGDHMNSVEILKYIHENLKLNDIKI